MAFWSSPHAHPVRQHEFMVTWGPLLSHTVKSVSKPTVDVNGSEYQVGNQWFKYPGVAKWGDVTITFVDDKTTTRAVMQQFIDQGYLIPQGQKRYGGMSLASGDEEVESTGGSFGSTAEEEAIREKEERDKENEKFNKQMEALNKKYRMKFSMGTKIPDPSFSSHTNDAMLKNKVGDVVITQHTIMTRATVKAAVAATRTKPAIPGGFGQQVSVKKILETWTLKNAWIKSINFGTLDYSSDELITIEVVISYDWCEVEFPAMSSMFQ